MAVPVSAYVSARGSVLSRARAAVLRARKGDRTVLEVGGPPRPLLRALLDEGTLRRALVLLERDGDHGSIAILPRRGRGLPSLAELLEEDHARLDAIADEMVRHLHVDPVRAIVLAHHFSAGMRRHVTSEEAILFPPYRAHFGTSGDATSATMEREHRAMLHYLDRLREAAERMLLVHEREHAAASVQRVLRGLAAVVAEHSDKEERIMFPLLDRTLGEGQRAELLRELVLF
jgi:iron-sulfur cluster repair protein YtfE (RIC family)